MQRNYSVDALNLIFDKAEQSKVVRKDSYACGCSLRTSYGLPCAHELSIYINDSQPIPLTSIDAFWKKLDLSPCVSLRDDDIDCTVELQMFAEQFKRHSRAGKFSLLRKIREIIKPLTTKVQDPIVKKSTRGRPSSKKKANMHTHCNPIALDPTEQSRHSISVGRPSSMKKAGGVTHTDSRHHSQQPGRHSCSSLYSSRSSNVTYEHIYVRQFPSILHPYIVSVQDVIPDGNCDFRAIAACFGFRENAWDIVRRDLIGELSAFWHEYVTLFGSEEHALGVHNTLNFFELDRAAPTQHWMIMPDTGFLIASRYNVILHVLSSAQSLTYLPLRSTPPPQYQHVAIAIGHVNNNHYVQISLAGGYPMPTIMSQWHYFRYECAAAWILPYMEQLDAYTRHIRPSFPPETIIIED